MPDVLVDDGARIHYEVFGKKGGPPLLMIQGLGTDSRGWAIQRLSLGRKFRCIAIDNRGTGQSDRPSGPYQMERMAADAIAVLDAEQVESAHILGASMGGVITQVIGVVAPERTRSLVLACTACRHHKWRRELLSDWAHAVAQRDMSALGEQALPWLVGPRLHRRFGMWLNLLSRIVLSGESAPFVSQVEGILMMEDTFSVELANIRVPTLAITGSQDLLTPVGDAEEIVERIPGAQLAVIPGAAHGLMVEAPTVFNRTILEFLVRAEATFQERPEVHVDIAHAKPFMVRASQLESRVAARMHTTPPATKKRVRSAPAPIRRAVQRSRSTSAST